MPRIRRAPGGTTKRLCLQVALVTLSTVAPWSAGTVVGAGVPPVLAHQPSSGPMVHVRIPARLPRQATPRASGLATASVNWSGYAQSAPNGTYTAITGSIVVPTVILDSGTEFSADWLGIGGYADASLIQAGIEVDNVAGNAYYRAWTEVLPAPESPLRLAIAPGDVVVISISEYQNNRWKMTVADTTTGRSATRKVRYRSTGSSAEAIMERPCIKGTCASLSDLANLAPTSQAGFDLVSTATSSPSRNPVYEPFMVSPNGATLYNISMLDNSGANVIATPSDSDADADGFAVQDGSSQPSSPPS